MQNNFGLNEINKIANNILQKAFEKKVHFILLSGEIGSGKTTLVKEIAKIFKEKNEILSPTFNFINIYKDFVHIDAYNLKYSNLDEFIDYFENKIIVIEWWENFSFVFKNSLLVNIKIVNENKRNYIIKYKSKI